MNPRAVKRGRQTPSIDRGCELASYKLRHAPSKLRHQIYRTTTLPKLEYCCAVWDPHQQVHKQSLENVQKFAARVITTNWTATYSSLCSRLNLQPLVTCRRIQKLKLCYNILHNHSCIPSDTFIPHPRPSPGYITLNLSSPLPSVPWPIDTPFLLMLCPSGTHYQTVLSLAHQQTLSKPTSTSP